MQTHYRHQFALQTQYYSVYIIINYCTDFVNGKQLYFGKYLVKIVYKQFSIMDFFFSSFLPLPLDILICLGYNVVYMGFDGKKYPHVTHRKYPVDERGEMATAKYIPELCTERHATAACPVGCNGCSPLSECDRICVFAQMWPAEASFAKKR